MEHMVNGIPVHYVEEGSGTPVLALHGWAVDHRLMSGSMEPLFVDSSGYRRIYPDLPGMGRTSAPDTINSSDDLLDAMLGLIDGVIGGDEFLLVGLSYGGYLARAIASRRPGQVPEEGAPPYAKPALILTGRQDSIVGYSAAWGWLGHYPRATFAVLDRAGHGLPHEQVGLFGALMVEWLERVSEHRPDLAPGTGN